MRLGGLDTIKVDTRIITATNVDLKSQVERGTFREDLFYRLNVISIQLPPLRDRKKDIPLLAAHFLQNFCDENNKNLHPISPNVLNLLMKHDWPGNVRELENVIERAVVLSSSEELTEELISLDESRISVKQNKDGPLELDGLSLSERVDGFEKQLIVQMLEEVNWSQTEAAEKFSVKLSTLNSKIKRLGINVKRKNTRS